jgi:uncharacterized membrane protein
MNSKLLAAAIALSAISLVPKESFAWFEVCNKKANGADMWVTYMYYEPNMSTVQTDACGSYETLYSPSYFEAWKVTGWWHLTANQCTTVYGGALTNTRSYVYAQISDGSTLLGANVPEQVVGPAFAIDQYITPHFEGSEPVETSGDAFCANPPNPWTVDAVEIWQAGYSNFTDTID